MCVDLELNPMGSAQGCGGDRMLHATKSHCRDTAGDSTAPRCAILGPAKLTCCSANCMDHRMAEPREGTWGQAWRWCSGVGKGQAGGVPGKGGRIWKSSASPNPELTWRALLPYMEALFLHQQKSC